MSSLNTLTGINGEFTVGGTAVARLTKWNVSATLATKAEWGDSDTGGYTARARGRKDATFSAEGKYDTSDEVWDLFEIGDNAAAVLYLDASLSLFWGFPRSLCMQFDMIVDVDTEDVIGWTSNWGADGAFTRPGAA